MKNDYLPFRIFSKRQIKIMSFEKNPKRPIFSILSVTENQDQRRNPGLIRRESQVASLLTPG